MKSNFLFLALLVLLVLIIDVVIAVPVIPAPNGVAPRAVSNAISGIVSARGSDISPVKFAPLVFFSPDNEVSQVNNGHKFNKRDGPYGTCINIYEYGGHSGRSMLNVCSPADQCITIQPAVGGWDSIGSLGFRGKTQCLLFTALGCAFNLNNGDEQISVGENSDGVDPAKGPNFWNAGPWHSLKCARSF